MMIAWNSCKFVKALETVEKEGTKQKRVVTASSYGYANISHGGNCKYSRNCTYVCRDVFSKEETYRRDDAVGEVCPSYKKWAVSFRKSVQNNQF